MRQQILPMRCAADIFLLLKEAFRVLGRHFLVLGLCLLPHVTWARPISVGSISTEPAAEIKDFLPLANYLAKQLRSEGVDEGRVVVAKSIPQMATYLREGTVDLYIDSPFPSLAVSRLSGSTLLLRRWKKVVSEYHSVIFVKADSDVNRLEHLRGKILAFEEPFSSSGYFFPKIALMQQGFRLVPKAAPTEAVDPAEVGYVFSWHDENTVVWVLRGKVAAGALDNHRFKKEASRNPNSLKVLYTTSSFPRHIVSSRADLPPSLVSKLKEILSKMDQSEEGRQVLQEFQYTAKFDEIPPPIHAQLVETLKFVDAELGLK